MPTINGNPSPILAQKDLRQAPIICAKPEHKESTTAGGSDATFERVVTFLFDQTLTGYNLNFQLDQKMNAIRYFRIKGVKIYGKGLNGKGLATGGNVSRSYTWSNNEWTAKAIQWSDLKKVNITEENAIKLAKNSETPFTPEYKEYMDIDDSKYHRWGTTFYAIAASVAEICEKIFSGNRYILPVATVMNGELGVKDVAVSLLALVSSEGVEKILEPDLTEEELEKFRKSAAAMKTFADGLGL